MKKRNIFQNQSQEILTLFNRSKVMCVPMDYAKNDHLVMFCNGNGPMCQDRCRLNRVKKSYNLIG